MSAYTNELLYQNTRKVAALTDGTPYAVYRLGPTTDTTVFNTLAIPAQPARFLATTSRKDTEVALYELGTFDGIFDGNPGGTAVRLGDVLVGEGGTYVWAEHRTCCPNICVRAEHRATISVAYDPDTPDDPSQTPVSVYEDHYEGPEQSTGLPLVLTNGVYSVGEMGQAPAVVPVGFMFQPRSPNTNDAELPNAEPRETRILYVAPTPGYFIGPNAVLDVVDPNGNDDLYTVLQSYDAGPANIAGTLLVVARSAVR